jgi:hypothetical protein
MIYPLNRCKIFDFPKSKDKGEGVHKSLVVRLLRYLPKSPSLTSEAGQNFVIDYFSDTLPEPVNNTKKRASPENAFESLMQSKGVAVNMIGKQPLYLQHNGHSRTVRLSSLWPLTL